MDKVGGTALFGEKGCHLSWLGQAGFALSLAGKRLLIDPYLSDYLADKYRGRRYPHERLMPPPIAVAELPPVDLVLLTHRHGDHMDPWTLAELLDHQTDCRFVLPIAERKHGLALGLPAQRCHFFDAGETIHIDRLRIAATPGAHEACDTDEAGHHRYLGYVLSDGAITLFHSGDTVPFPALDSALAAQVIDVALLPVNGRDEERRANGVPGNMTLTEAVDLCRRHRIKDLVVHHFSMFAFNTLAVEEIDRALTEAAPQIRGLRPKPGLRYRCEPGP
ncbi:MAG: MBL fold metallo-hydrolase [Geminicoccaceae bacterium]